MTGIRSWKVLCLVAGCALAVFAPLSRSSASEGKTLGPADCSFVSDPDAFLGREARVRNAVAEQARRAQRFAVSRSAQPVPAGSLPVRNFIDEEIFGKLAQSGVAAAPRIGDEQFLRRVTLDLAGRLPGSAEIRAFLDDKAENKRDAAIDRLLWSPEFTDRWTMWMGDWLQNTQALVTGANRQVAGRTAFYHWIQDAVFSEKALKDVAYEVIVAAGNNFDNGPANYPYGAQTAMGPIQDTFDTMLARSATQFLGMSHYDCLLCHNGRGHTEALSLWATRTTRADAWKMAAFFSRMRNSGRSGNEPGCQATDSCAGMFHRGSIDVVDQARGQYDLSNFYGNRPYRQPVGQVKSLRPVYRTGASPSDDNWRSAFADNLIQDPMFARNLANRLWKQMFNLALAEPFDQLDPARLDPANPPEAPWGLQASHPVLLEKLAAELRDNNYGLRQFLRLLVQSNAYQLDSRYDGEWNVQYVPLFARHYARRLEAEEVHDAIARATGVLGNYTVNGFAERVKLAMQLPDTVEASGQEGGLLNTFFRGNRDTQPRSQQGSIQQQLLLMNNSFITNRTNVNNSPKLKEVAALPNSDAIVDELWLKFLSRYPSAYERPRALAVLSKAANPAQRNTAVEDLAWALINKVEFLFSY